MEKINPMKTQLDPDYRLLLEAASFAARAHQGQLRKDKQTPYAAHVFRVCLIVRDLFGFDDRRMLLTALLHDTIEDTTTDFDDVEEKFGAEVARWTAILTKDTTLPEKEREAKYIDKLLAAPWQVQACKLADVFDNLTDIQSMPAERHAHAVARAEQYLAALKTQKATELKKPLAWSSDC